MPYAEAEFIKNLPRKFTLKVGQKDNSAITVMHDDKSCQKF